MANVEKCFIRAQVMGVLPSGQKRIRLLATGADGIGFYTDDESLIPADGVRVVVQGKWINRNKNGYPVFECSVCKNEALLKNVVGVRHVDLLQALTPFCPYCSAIMDLKE